MNILESFAPGVCWENAVASLLLNFDPKTYSYALTKNLTYEPGNGRMQGPSGQHPVIPAAIPYGDTGNCDFV